MCIQVFKNGLRFELRPSYDGLSTRSQCAADGQSGCSLGFVIAFSVHWKSNSFIACTGGSIQLTNVVQKLGTFAIMIFVDMIIL